MNQWEEIVKNIRLCQLQEARVLVSTTNPLILLEREDKTGCNIFEIIIDIALDAQDDLLGKLPVKNSEDAAKAIVADSIDLIKFIAQKLDEQIATSKGYAQRLLKNIVKIKDERLDVLSKHLIDLMSNQELNATRDDNPEDYDTEDDEDEGYDTILMGLVRYINIEVFDYLLLRINNEIINYKAQNGNTALLKALDLENIPVALRLIHKMNDNALNAVTVNESILDETTEIGESCTALVVAAYRGNKEAVQLLLERESYKLLSLKEDFGFNDDYTYDTDGNKILSAPEYTLNCALTVAVLEGHTEICKMLISIMPINAIIDPDTEGNTALKWIGYNNNLELCKFLVPSIIEEFGENHVSLRDMLEEARRLQGNDVAQYLMEWGVQAS
jgi:ankyrin repeat protein